MDSLWRNLAPSGTLAVRCTTAAWTSVMSNLSAARSHIVAEDSQLNGLIAAAGIQQIRPAIVYTMDKINEGSPLTTLGSFLSATAMAREMKKYKS
ncbi:hypothetical protein VE02_09672 [Pseudogymnoascus sp. 03VT05]|nr:hypothetical protein VE02_09672 [Pseudogymnoascus sp. 03VT05]